MLPVQSIANAKSKILTSLAAMPVETMPNTIQLETVAIDLGL